MRGILVQQFRWVEMLLGLSSYAKVWSDRALVELLRSPQSARLPRSAVRGPGLAC